MFWKQHSANFAILFWLRNFYIKGNVIGINMTNICRKIIALNGTNNALTLNLHIVFSVWYFASKFQILNYYHRLMLRGWVFLGLPKGVGGLSKDILEI